MPSSYTHYKFGMYVFNYLPGSIQKMIGSKKELFDIGLYGPTILYYYKGIFPNKIKQTSIQSLELSTMPIFKNRFNLIKDESDLSYMLGFICHYILDNHCHSYIENYVHAYNITQTEVETEYERKLLIQDGMNPLNDSFPSHIIPSLENAKIIQHFFPKLSDKAIQQSLKDMIAFNKFFHTSSNAKKILLQIFLSFTKHYKEMQGHIFYKKPNKKCMVSNFQLDYYFEEAGNNAVNLIENYIDTLNNNGDLNMIIKKTFHAS